MNDDGKIMKGKLRRNILGVVAVTATLLLLAFVLKQATGNPEWTAGDFILVGMMLLGTGLAYVLITHRKQETIYRLAVALAAATGLLLFWSNLAVGLIGSEDEPANLIYFGVLAVAFIGSVIGRFQPRGLAVAMWVTAGVQVLTIIIALLAGWQHLAESSVVEIIGVNGFFTVLWVASALLYRKAGKKERINIS
ncbi:MAG: hypothetical protein QHH44_07775 [Candidatus Saccharicenans sp.]|jgi:hypothetical protein|nr:hypothetical protein [Candidatus Saccharicenans sp.]